MEKQNLNNKLADQSKQMLKELGEGFTNLTEFAASKIDEANKTLKANMSPKEYVRYQAFQKKYTALVMDGKHKEAQKLADHYGK